MTSGLPPASRLTRRRWAMILASAPALAQVTSRVPPEGPPAPASPAAPPDQKLDKAIDDIRSVSKRLSLIEVPMNVEPAFSFKV